MAQSLAFTSKDGGDRFQENSQIKQQVPILDVVVVEIHGPFKRRMVPGGYLPQAGQAWLNVQPSEMFQAVALVIVEGMRPGSDQAHVPLQGPRRSFKWESSFFCSSAPTTMVRNL